MYSWYSNKEFSLFYFDLYVSKLRQNILIEDHIMSSIAFLICVYNIYRKLKVYLPFSSYGVEWGKK